MNLFQWLSRHRPRAVRYSEAAERWAASRFPEQFQAVSSIVGDVLCEQIGVSFGDLEPHTNFIIDLGMDDLEPVEVVMALEEEFRITIPAADSERLDNISMLVQYLHSRINEPKPGNSELR